ncbi:hypothetical protein CVT26_005175 [Gymnopilus dilepis]|uniref:Transmembrane protein n=1 Tax=Gymnopilus dilepis TaxID=231916 RepID=A0A409WHE1_9AGAR|nr:hypothetical protein CVT26_005175 [Gymnopilus dilepis]
MQCPLQVDKDAPLLSHHFVLLAAFALQLWDTILGVSEEVVYIWRRDPTEVDQASVFSGAVRFSGPSMVEIAGFRACKIPVLYRTITVQLAVTLSEAMSLRLLFFLFNKGVVMGYAFGCIFILSFSCEIFATSMVIAEVLRSPACIFELSGRYLLFGVGAGLFQCCLAIGIIARLVFHGRNRTPLSSLLLKNNLTGLALSAASSVTILLYNLVCAPALKADEGSEISNVAYSWFLVVLSTMISRLLLNVRKLASKRRNRRSDDEDFSGEEL